jgi:hypothetical protein
MSKNPLASACGAVIDAAAARASEAAEREATQHTTLAADSQQMNSPAQTDTSYIDHADGGSRIESTPSVGSSPTSRSSRAHAGEGTTASPPTAEERPREYAAKVCSSRMTQQLRGSITDSTPHASSSAFASSATAAEGARCLAAPLDSAASPCSTSSNELMISSSESFTSITDAQAHTDAQTEMQAKVLAAAAYVEAAAASAAASATDPRSIMRLHAIEMRLVMQYLDIYTAMRLARCCRHLRIVASDPFAWPVASLELGTRNMPSLSSPLHKFLSISIMRCRLLRSRYCVAYAWWRSPSRGSHPTSYATFRRRG